MRPLIAQLTVAGYSGVAVYTRSSKCVPIRAEEGITGVLAAPRTPQSFRDLPVEQQIGGYPQPGQLSDTIDEMTLDSEGRCVILEFPAFVLIGVYSPANRDESRDDFRLAFLKALDVRVRNLIALGKQVVLLGDLNVVRSEMDSSNVSETIRKSDMTMEEWLSTPSRRLFNHLVFDGWVQGERDEDRGESVLWDLCRCFHPTRQGMNTCWDTKKNTRPANYGSRIDYILCSNSIKPWFIDADIQEGLMGSDHCPVFADTVEMVSKNGRDVHLLDLMNPFGMVKNGIRRRAVEQKDLLALSAKLIPEFDRRQNIRDMFMKRGSYNSTSRESSQGATGHEQNQEGGDKGQRAMPKRSSAPSVPNIPNSPTKDTPSLSPKANPSMKRTAGPISPQGRTKRAKPGATGAHKGDVKIPAGQKTLKGFFKPRNTSSNLGKTTGAFTTIEERSQTSPSTNSEAVSKLEHVAMSELRQINDPKTSGEDIFDPIEAKESWSKLLGKRSVPRCEHAEPCISLITKKPGINCGKHTRSMKADYLWSLSLLIYGTH